MELNALYEQFIREKKYLCNVTRKTEEWYRQSWNALTRSVGTPETLDRPILNEFVIKLRESGIAATSVNVYTCAINSFFTWLHENEHINEKLKIKALNEDQKIIKTFTDAHIERLIHHKPKKLVYWRL